MSALVGESYERAYADMVRVQQLTELEEIVIVKAAERATKSMHCFISNQMLRNLSLI